MKNWYKESTIAKKTILALALLMISSIAAIAVNYKSLGVFRLVHKNIPIYSVDTKEKKVAITFDVSWGDDNTLKLLDILDKYNAKSTFFLVGGWIGGNENMVKEIVNRGHELGNHTNKHPDTSSISRDKLIQEVIACDAKINSITGQGSSKLFRFPEGAYSDLGVKTLEDLGYYCIQWDVDSIDWRENGADIEYNRVIKNTKPGSILLFHNNAKYTPQTLPKILDKLQKEGYSFVKVSDLIYKDNYYIDASGKQIAK